MRREYKDYQFLIMKKIELLDSDKELINKLAKMKSDLHQKLQDKAENYLLNNAYWIIRQEAQTSTGICDVWGIRHIDYKTMAIEVKVSKSDHRSRSQKYKEYNSGVLANKNFIFSPEWLILPKEVNPHWGLLWYNEATDRIQNIKQPTELEQTDFQKLEILIHFLFNGVNKNKL